MKMNYNFVNGLNTSTWMYNNSLAFSTDQNSSNSEFFGPKFNKESDEVPICLLPKLGDGDVRIRFSKNINRIFWGGRKITIPKILDLIQDVSVCFESDFIIGGRTYRLIIGKGLLCLVKSDSSIVPLMVMTVRPSSIQLSKRIDKINIRYSRILTDDPYYLPLYKNLVIPFIKDCTGAVIIEYNVFWSFGPSKLKEFSSQEELYTFSNKLMEEVLVRI